MKADRLLSILLLLQTRIQAAQLTEEEPVMEGSAEGGTGRPRVQ
ncbi:hypothetical protein [Streptomyces sp. NPDC058155]